MSAASPMPRLLLLFILLSRAFDAAVMPQVWVVALFNLTATLLQTLAARVGLGNGKYHTAQVRGCRGQAASAAVTGTAAVAAAAAVVVPMVQQVVDLSRSCCCCAA